MIVLFTNICAYCIIIPIFVGLGRFSKLETETKWLLYMLVPVSIIQIFSIWWSNFVTINNLPFFHLYILVEILFISKMYSLYLKNSRSKFVIWLLTSLFLLLFLLKFVTNWNSIWEYSTYLRAIEALIVIIYASSYFIHEYRKQEVMYFHKSASFWISSGLILYFSCNLLLFGFSELVFSQQIVIFQYIWVIHAILLILLYLSFTIAFLCKKKVTTF